MDEPTTPSEVMLKVNVQPELKATNVTDKDGNPTGGNVTGKGLNIGWQDGPRGQNADGSLGASNGAFVEDAIWAAVQRLEFFQESKYADPANATAVSHLHSALMALDVRRQERAARGVEGQHKV